MRVFRSGCHMAGASPGRKGAPARRRPERLVREDPLGGPWILSPGTPAGTGSSGSDLKYVLVRKTITSRESLSRAH